MSTVQEMAGRWEAGGWERRVAVTTTCPEFLVDLSPLFIKDVATENACPVKVMIYALAYSVLLQKGGTFWHDVFGAFPCLDPLQ